jgi:hypothetical protein
VIWVMKRLLPAVAAFLLVPAGAAVAIDRSQWPQINGKTLTEHGPPGSHFVLRGDKHRHNMLLGGYGNDTIYGGEVGDVIWADDRPSGQPANQVTTIYAGNGKNFIYASHGTNFIFTGTGPSAVLAHYGRGTITCGSSLVTVTVSHMSRPHYELPGCRHVSFD